MRQYADRPMTSMRQYAELPAEDYAAVCGSSGDAYSASCGFRCMFSKRWINATSNQNWTNRIVLRKMMKNLLALNDKHVILLMF